MKRRVYIRYAQAETEEITPKQRKELIDRTEIPVTARKDLTYAQWIRWGDGIRMLKASQPDIVLRDTTTLSELEDMVYSMNRCQVCRLTYEYGDLTDQY